MASSAARSVESGRTVTRNGRGVFGAHVEAFDLLTGSLVGNFSLNDQGRFSIAGLSPGDWGPGGGPVAYALRLVE